MRPCIVQWLLIVSSMATSTVVGFMSPATTATTTHHRSSSVDNLVLFSTKYAASDTMGGVEAFESWFPSMKNVRHALFQSDSLRGLEFLGEYGKDNEDILKLPSSLVLSAPFDDNDDWDVTLATQLLQECKAGTSSPLYGYCALLCQGQQMTFSGNDDDDDCPPWTAPHALRHWTEEEVSALEDSTRGKKLVNAMKQQTSKWEDKFLQIENPFFTQTQFIWAMEAVHSRAFCGDFGFASQGTAGLLKQISIPLSFAAFALNYILLQNNNDNLFFTVGLALIGFSPLLLNTFLSGDSSKGDAVLLPLIDSANHVEQAQSIIQFDPIQNAFTLSIGRNCLVKDTTSGKKQLVISYGAKRDSELLLNYGFLPGVTNDKDESNYRLRLAQAYTQS